MGEKRDFSEQKDREEPDEPVVGPDYRPYGITNVVRIGILWLVPKFVTDPR